MGFDYFVLILFGSMASRGVQHIVMLQGNNEFISLPTWAWTKGGQFFTLLSLILLIILACINGYILDGLTGLFIVGISTYAGGPILHLFLFSWINILSPLAQFYLLWPAYFVYSIKNIVSFF